MRKSDVMSECIRWMSAPELPRSSALREMVVETLLSIEVEDGPHGGDAGIGLLVMGLVRAYDGACEYEDVEAEHDGKAVPERVRLEGAKAENYLADVYVSAEIVTVDAYEDDEDTREHVREGFCWPEALRYDYDYDKRLLRRIGIALGYLNGRRTNALHEWFQREEAKKTG